MITPRIRTPGSWIPIQQPNPLGSGPWILGPDPETLVLDPGFWVRIQKPWFRNLDFGSGPRNLGSGPWILGPDPETLVPDPGFWVRTQKPWFRTLDFGSASTNQQFPQPLRIVRRLLARAGLTAVDLHCRC